MIYARPWSIKFSLKIFLIYIFFSLIINEFLFSCTKPLRMLRTRGDSCLRPRRRRSVWPPRCRTRSSTWRSRCHATTTWSASNDGEQASTNFINTLSLYIIDHSFYLTTIFENRQEMVLYSIDHTFELAQFLKIVKKKIINHILLFVI